MFWGLIHEIAFAESEILRSHDGDKPARRGELIRNYFYNDSPPARVPRAL